jgi:hypothetical protein
MCCMLSVLIARLSTYVMVVHVKGNVLKSYHMSFFFVHLKNGSKNMMNRWKLRVPLCMVQWPIYIACIVPKWFSKKDLVEFLYIFPIIKTTAAGKLRSYISASSLAWSLELNALWKFIYVKYMSMCIFKGCLHHLDLFCGVTLWLNPT